MGVYIKGIEMPTSCRACRLKMNCDDCEGWKCVCLPLRMQIGYLDDLLTDKRRDDCPLIPVPPHGRLIDADALIIALETQDYSCAPDTLEEWTPMDMTEAEIEDIRNAPTIIPAEEGE